MNWLKKMLMSHSNFKNIISKQREGKVSYG